jgi:hypothetical protein
MDSRANVEIDAGALIRAKRGSAKKFEELVRWYRQRGVTDRELVAAMAASRVMIAPSKLLKGKN